MILIKLCVTIKMKQAVSICCIVFLVITISMNHEEGYILYTYNRVLDTTIGILIALLVNKYMKIPEQSKVMQKDELKEPEVSENIKEEEYE